MRKITWREKQQAKQRWSDIGSWCWVTARAISDKLQDQGLQVESAKTIAWDVVWNTIEEQKWLTSYEKGLAGEWICENLERIFTKEW